ncbi:chlorite dismutase [Leucobacter exalbidus]|uniref:Coproheme decarboxylase n=1 Tax=Leucobacter exalbidus TaxID=662960 RepID=A0A940PZL8_9MICO|nr:hydrogen peroxide-dependent heme synthase [Leucobacter exalbidus]MBP1327026.1 chlorite dismutase [Leucobacter exalbidus]
MTSHPVMEQTGEQSPSGYTLWAVFRRDPAAAGTAGDAAAGTAELTAAVDAVTASGVTLRGWYDVSGLRADADLMVWLHGDTAEGLQSALRVLRRTALIAGLLPTWNALGVHRDAEFNRAHVPGFLRGEAARDWLVLYPFVRDTEWYLLPEAERRRMLADHGRKGAEFRGVVANTVSSFALGDYEWLLPLESDDLTELVDLMRALRATDARRHMREETPFYTGRRVTTAEVAEVIR